MVTLNVVVVAHRPADGVKVYTPEFMLSTADGLHVPVMPLADVLTSAGTVAPAQIFNEVPNLNEGTILGVTVTEYTTVAAHCPAVGVNV
jgi:hypothetical protein